MVKALTWQELTEMEKIRGKIFFMEGKFFPCTMVRCTGLKHGQFYYVNGVTDLPSVESSLCRSGDWYGDTWRLWTGLPDMKKLKWPDPNTEEAKRGLMR